MKITSTNLADVLLIEPTIFHDERGFFFESFNSQQFSQELKSSINFAQDNHSKSKNNVLRGLHYQVHQTQGKLVRVTSGEIFDVAVDLRKNSPQFGQWTGQVLSSNNHLQHWIPAGFAHGFLVLSDFAECLYKTTDFWAPEHERCLRWDDPQIGIQWPLPDQNAPQLSNKDALGKNLADAELFI